MNQDQAREFDAFLSQYSDEDQEQLLRYALDHWLPKHKGRSPAIAAALVKLTQGQEPVGYTSPNELTRIAACKGQFADLHRERIGSNDVAVYTLPIHSQQEERKPLTEFLIDSASHNTKEQQK